MYRTEVPGRVAMIGSQMERVRYRTIQVISYVCMDGKMQRLTGGKH